MIPTIFLYMLNSGDNYQAIQNHIAITTTTLRTAKRHRKKRVSAHLKIDTSSYLKFEIGEKWMSVILIHQPLTRTMSL